MIKARIQGQEQVVVRIKRIYPSLREQLKMFCEAFKINTIYYIQSQKLSGQVLHQRKGTLNDSVPGASGIEETGALVKVHVGAWTTYAAIHEYGGQTSPHEIFPKHAKALAFRASWGPGRGKGGLTVLKSVQHPGSKMPVRSYLRTTLQERKEEFRQGLMKVAQKAGSA